MPYIGALLISIGRGNWNTHPFGSGRQDTTLVAWCLLKNELENKPKVTDTGQGER